MNGRRDLAICLALALAAVAVFWPVAGAQFVQLDDYGYVLNNAHVRAGLTWDSVGWAFTSTEQYNWHPLTWLSHMVDCTLFNAGPAGHHLSSLLLHIASTLMLFFVLKRMTGWAWRSAVVAALFAVHPLHVESVAWVSERKDVLSALLAMVTLYAYARYAERPGFLRYLLVLGGLALGLMAKPMLVTLPLVMLLLDFWPLGRLRRARPDGGLDGREAKRGRAARSEAVEEVEPAPAWAAGPEAIAHPQVGLMTLLGEKVPLLALAVISSAVTWWAQQTGGAMAFGEDIPLATRLANALVSYATYLSKTFVPMDMTVRYPYVEAIPAWQWAGGAAVLVAVTVAVLALRRRPYLAVGWFWFVGMLVPVIGLVQVSSQAMADRYTYVPLVGIFIMVVWGAADLLAGLRARAGVLAAAAGGAIVALGVVAFLQVQTWADSPTLFYHAIKVTTNNWLPHYALASYWEQEGKMDDAIAEYREAAEIVRKDASVRIKIGVLLDGQGKTEEAAKAFQEAVNCLASCEGHDGRLEAAVLDIRKAAELCPKCVSVRVCLGSLLDRQGKTEDAARAFQEAIDTVPTDEISNQRDVAHAYYNLGRMRLVEGNTEEAVNCFRDALGILPEYAAAHVELGSLLEERGKVAEAAIHYKNVVRMIPRTAAGHLAAGRAYLALGGTAQAVQHFSKALAMKADLAQAHIGLGIAYSELGSFVEATREFHAAAVLKPDDPVVHRELGLALMNEGRVEEALTHFREVFRMRPASPQAMNNLAWVLATSPDPKFRNGPEAVELSEKAGKLAAEEEPNRLGTLAAAYAEVGRFDDAVRVCEKAHALALRSGLDELAKVLDDRLDLFRSKNPYREQLHSLLRPHGKVIADEIGIVPEEEFGKTPAAESVKVPGSGEAGATAEAGMARTGT